MREGTQKKYRIKSVVFSIACAGLLCAVSSWAAGEQEQGETAPLSAPEYYQKGRDCVERGEYEQANEYFKKAETLLREEHSLPDMSRMSPAEKKAVAAETAQKTIVEQAARAFARNQFDKALEFYKYAAEQMPKNSDLYYNMGIVYLKKEDYSRAGEAFTKVTELDPRDADAWYNLGVIYESFLSEKGLAVNSYKRYVALADRESDVREVKKWIRYLESQME